jgi:L-alanine-DL-glutamate epimerase-like enolase superfamily enzyme
MRSKAISRAAVDAVVLRVAAAAYEIPTDRPESDGTLEWTSTTLVVAEVDSAEMQGIGYTYAPRAAAQVIADTLTPVVSGRDAMDVTAAWMAMRAAVRNQGLPGICAEAIAAVDAALWDLKARLLGLPLSTLLGAVRTAVPVYGSGGFTSYTIDELGRQLGGWVESGLSRVKMKVGRDRQADPRRVEAARRAIGGDAELFVDANGAWTPSEATAMAQRFAESRVSWFEEPVTSDDLDGLRRVREHAPPGMAVTAGEYGYDLSYFRRMLQAGAVDVLQADASRCGGISGFLAAGALADAFAVPVSAHTAPLLHLAPCCALPRVAHIEYFHDHVRIERMLFDGLPQPHQGALAPDLSRPGLGLAFKRADAAPYRVM